MQQRQREGVCQSVCTCTLQFDLHPWFHSHYSCVGHWVFGDFMCHFTSGLHSLGFFSSIFFMVAMTLDRYVVIMHALTVARHRTLRMGAFLSMCVWVLSLLISLPNFVLTEVKNISSVLHCEYKPESSDWRKYNLVTMNVIGLVIPLLVMIVCYSRIIPTLVNMRSAKKHRVVKLIITIVAVFFLSWTPLNIVLILFHLQEESDSSHDCNLKGNLTVAVLVTEVIAYAHCCLNPIIYAFVGQKFMRRVSRMMRMWLPCLTLFYPRDLSESFSRKASASSRSSEFTPTLVL
ncbi:C-C chemokine receptor type 3-like isoform X2 [Genypterus blacodes]|uniref:C-C chemokine receptor type 3-like isoform X2 n=1 Tax=Genypterus blacodes TaxID=154954 RepID=UPI003F76E0A0